MQALLNPDTGTLTTEIMIQPGNWETFRKGSFTLEAVAQKVKELLDQKHTSSVYILENFCAAIQGYEERSKNRTCADKIFSCFCCFKDKNKEKIKKIYKTERAYYFDSRSVQLGAYDLINVFSERAVLQKSDNVFKDLTVYLSKRPALSIKSKEDWQEQFSDFTSYINAAKTFRDLVLFKKLDTSLSLFEKRVKQNLETLLSAATQKFPSDPALSELAALIANTIALIPETKNSRSVFNTNNSRTSGGYSNLELQEI